MNKWQAILILVSGVPWAIMWLYPPWLEGERVYQASGPHLDPGDTPDQVREIGTRPAGYAWRFTGPQRKESPFASAVTYRVDNGCLALQWALLQVVLFVGLAWLEPVRATVMTWRGHLAARIPVLCGAALILVWFLPIQRFLLYTLGAGTWFPVLGLTLLGVVVGICLPASYFRLRRVEADGRIYIPLGVRRFRKFVSNGDLVVRLVRWIDPGAFLRVSRCTLAQREADTRAVERFHSIELLYSVPVAVWAVLVGESWFAVYLAVANIPKNIYPILLQRYTRARLARIREHARCRAKEGVAAPGTAFGVTPR